MSVDMNEYMTIGRVYRFRYGAWAQTPEEKTDFHAFLFPAGTFMRLTSIEPNATIIGEIVKDDCTATKPMVGRVFKMKLGFVSSFFDKFHKLDNSPSMYHIWALDPSCPLQT